MPDLISQEQAAAILNCSVSKIRKLRRMGALAWIKGRPVMIRREDLDKYIERNRVDHSLSWLRAQRERQAKLRSKPNVTDC